MCCGNSYIQVQLTRCQVNKKRREGKGNFDDETLEVSDLPQAEKATAEQPRGPLGSSWEARVGIWKIGLCLFSFFRLLFFFSSDFTSPCNFARATWTRRGSLPHRVPPLAGLASLGGRLQAGEEGKKYYYSAKHVSNLVAWVAIMLRSAGSEP